MIELGWMWGTGKGAWHGGVCHREKCRIGRIAKSESCKSATLYKIRLSSF